MAIKYKKFSIYLYLLPVELHLFRCSVFSPVNIELKEPGVGSPTAFLPVLILNQENFELFVFFILTQVKLKFSASLLMLL